MKLPAPGPGVEDRSEAALRSAIDRKAGVDALGVPDIEPRRLEAARRGGERGEEEALHVRGRKSDDDLTQAGGIGEVVAHDDEPRSQIAGELGEGIEDLVVVIGDAHDARLGRLPARAIGHALLAGDGLHDLNGDRAGRRQRGAGIRESDRGEAEKSREQIAAGIAISDGDVGDRHIRPDLAGEKAQARRSRIEQNLARRPASHGDRYEIGKSVSFGIGIQRDVDRLLS